MAFKFKCPECGISLLASDNSVGNEMHCPSCQATFPVPEPSRQSPPRPSERKPSSPNDEGDRPRPRREPDFDDEYDPPRRRRPSRSSGRGPLVVIGIIFGVLFLGSCTCCGGGYALLPDENWRTYQSPQGGFSVEIPVEPKQDMKAYGVKPDSGVRVEGGLLWKRGEFYTISYGEVTPKFARAASDDQILREMVQALSTNPESRVLRDTPITVSGFPGREVEFAETDGGTNLARVVLADRRVYVVMGGGRFVKTGNPNIRRFVDSFKVNNTNPFPNGVPPTRWK
jgi:hypothetical protein